jgi:Tol biopolymer transport system component
MDGIRGFVLIGIVAALASACEPAPPGGSCTSDADCGDGERCTDGRCAPRPDGSTAPAEDGGSTDRPDAGRAELTALEITPADPTVVSVDRTPATIDLELLARYDDGSTRTLATGFWSVDSRRLGAIDATTGEFTANGALAGTVQVTVEALGRTAETTLRVEVERTLLGEGVPADAADRFAGTPVDDAARASNLLYPLEGTVFPQNVYPPDVQWERGAEGDLYRVWLETTGVRVTAFVAHSGAGFAYHWLVDRDAWRALAEAAPETDVTLRVDRWEASSGEVIAGGPRAFRFADAVITGSIYYWDLAGGRILRIRGDGTGLEAFMPNPPPRPSDGRRCVACHSISRDGSRMAAELWDGGDYGAVFDLTEDLSGDPAPTVVPPDRQRFLTASFDPTATRLIANAGNELFLMDANTGDRITPAAGTPLPTAGAAHPTWSPDGSLIAFVTNTNGGWGVDFTQGDLGMIDVGVAGADTFGPQRTIFAGGDRTVARPSWSPDSQWVAFQHGEHSRAFEDPGAAPSIRRDAVIRMVSRDGSTVFDLEALNGGAENSYYPTFSPFDEGGYYWLGFFSTRDYGNAQAGTRGTGRRQLWVAAVSSSPTPGTDPSHAAYWLPQQDVGAENMAGFWAPEPCRTDGRSCSASGECCSGFCRDEGEGPVCVPPDTVPCSEAGEACSEDGDCCEGAGVCVANVCTSLM